MKHALEENKIFPYLVWFLVIVAVIAVYKLTSNYQKTFSSLEERRILNEESLEISADSTEQEDTELR